MDIETHQKINKTSPTDNKEILLVSLLEYICSEEDQSNKIFNSICNYLHTIGVIENPKSYSKKVSTIRSLLSSYIIRMINDKGKNKLLKDESDISHINHFNLSSRYVENFIEIN